MGVVKKGWQYWLRIAKPIGNFQSQVILSMFYLLILLPFGIIFRLSDPLKMKSLKRKSNFSRWEYSKENIGEARRQY